MTELKEWARSNATLLYFLVGQFLAIATAGLTFTAYMVKLETRVAILEIRGSPHLSTIDNRLTVLESKTTENKERLERVVDILTREMGKTVK